MKLLAFPTALVAAALALAPLAADAQVSRKDYERRDRTTAIAPARSEPAAERSSRTSRRPAARTTSRSTPSRGNAEASPPSRGRPDRGVSRKSDWSDRGRPVPATSAETRRDTRGTRRRPATPPRRAVTTPTVYRAPAPVPAPRRRGVRVYRPNVGGANVAVFLGSFAGEYFAGSLGRRERARFQRDLEARARDLQLWAVELERREAFLERRRPRVERVARRYDLPPARRLRTRELYQWDDLLQRRAVRLDDLEREVSRRERRRNRRWRRGYDDGWGGDYRPEDYRRDSDYCPPGW